MSTCTWGKNLPHVEFLRPFEMFDLSTSKYFQHRCLKKFKKGCAAGKAGERWDSKQVSANVIMSTGRSGIFSGLNIWAGNDDLRNCDSHFVFPPRSTFPQQPRQYLYSLPWNVLTFNVLMMCNVMWNKLKQLKLKKYEIYIKIFFKCPGGVFIWFVGFTKQWPCFLCFITHWNCVCVL